jgi:hypothetical protein
MVLFYKAVLCLIQKQLTPRSFEKKKKGLLHNKRQWRAKNTFKYYSLSSARVPKLQNTLL